jgi:hypothetical protein
MNKRVRVVIGCAYLFGLLVLATLIGIFHVEEKTSYGLAGIISIIGTVGIQIAQSLFPTPRRSRKDNISIDEQAER